jgi:hypothetical protein
LLGPRLTQNLGNYAFGYDENHSTGGTFRRESSDAWGNKVGSYGLRDADGRVRVVNYVADGHGFRAAVSSNEPGVAPQLHAAATISKPGVAVIAAPAVAAPLYAAPAVAAPIYAAPSAYAPSLYAPSAAALVGPAAYAPAAYASSHAGLLAAPIASYAPAYAHSYPIRR